MPELSPAQTVADFVIDNDKPVTGQTYSHLRLLILRLALWPGEALSENDLAAKLGISRTPVREAFIRLAAEGLVDIMPQRGTIVSPIRMQEIEEAYFVRHAMEMAVVKRAAQQREPEPLARLKANLAEQKQALTNGDHHAFMDLDDDFHRILTEGVGLPRTWRMIQSVKGQMDRVRFISLPKRGHAKLIQEQHRAIFDAVTAGDARRAQSRMHEHLHEIWGSIGRLMRDNAELFQNSGSGAMLKRK